jgi:hypothetical protein
MEYMCSRGEKDEMKVGEMEARTRRVREDAGQRGRG